MYSGIAAFIVVVVVTLLFKCVRIVPQQTVFIVERLGRFNGALEAGLHLLVPFIDRIAYKVPLQEIPLQTSSQSAITSDNVTITLDGILYYQVTNPRSAAYGTSNFQTAIEMLAQTTLRAEVGKRELDKLLIERGDINTAVVEALDAAGVEWGVKCLRYEVKDLVPPQNLLAAMQLQLVAEREKRALIARSEGQRQEQINLAEGRKQADIAASEGESQAAINRAKGEASAILEVAKASAEALRSVAAAANAEGGDKAMQLKVAEQYIAAFGNIAKTGNTVVVPANLTDLGGQVTSLLAIAKGVQPAVPAGA
ncbi:SPFH domain-containing protein [Burkholderia cenocepacia]|uniref:SPFH domain-containing protein n=1 Tax=Burkholderia cenocepacia TaxID=95486 RepID=UPI000760FBD5|nr:SPFH domain-containing protein [Burkholderia cenocepacia]KWU19130.1 stomatin 2 [Burkholderia cenocepacia]